MFYCASWEVAFLLLLILLILFFIFFFIKENEALKNFVLIYLLFSFIFSTLIFAINITNYLSQEVTTGGFHIEDDSINKFKKTSKENLYFVIVDGAVPLDKFDEHYNTNHYSSYEKKFKKMGFDYVKDTKSTSSFIP